MIASSSFFVLVVLSSARQAKIEMNTAEKPIAVMSIALLTPNSSTIFADKAGANVLPTVPQVRRKVTNTAGAFFNLL